MIRRRLPLGIAAVEFCGQHIVVVSSQLSDHDACVACALARARCDGVFVIVMMSELALRLAVAS